MCRVFSLPCLVCLSVCGSLLPFSPFCLSASSATTRVSPTQLPLRTCSAACLAARQVLRRPLALRMCGPWSTRIHKALCHHVMCLFDTWHSSCTEFTSSSCPPSPLGLNYSLLLSSLHLSTHFSLAPPELWRLLRSLLLSCLLRSDLVLTRLLLSPLLFFFGVCSSPMAVMTVGFAIASSAWCPCNFGSFYRSRNFGLWKNEYTHSAYPDPHVSL